MIWPGFVDLQVNGFKGVDFSSDTLTAEGIRTVSEALLRRGTVGYCPTVITSPLNTYRHVLPLLASEMQSQKGSKILGIHLEGPFISPEDGARGIHPPQLTREPSVELFEELHKLAGGATAIITLAPERKGALELIRHIANRTATTAPGIVVALGHHNADAATIEQACEAGAKASTHLGNGLPEEIHRHLNPIWPQLADDRLICSFISDGFHLPSHFLRSALRAKGPDRFIVVSDMVSTAGQKPGEYEFHGVPVVLEENRHLHRKGAYQLAGSASDMLNCMNVIAGLKDLNPSGLRKVGTDNALRLLGFEKETGLPLPNPQLVFEGNRFRTEGS